MSFLAGRLAGKEGAYFFQESKHAVTRLSQKIPTKNLPSSSPSEASARWAESEAQSQADVLPEVLRHSLPSKIFRGPTDPSNLSNGKWVLHLDPKNVSSVSPDVLNPLRAYLSLPQVTFGPKRWELPSTEHSFLASTANELRQDRHAPINPEKLKAAAEGLAQIGKAFAVGTAIVFGGATLLFSLAASKLDLQNSDSIRTKGRDLVEPTSEIIRQQVVPLKSWAEKMSKKWHLEKQEDIKEKPIIKELSKILGVKTSN